MNYEKQIALLTERLVADVKRLYERELSARLAASSVTNAQVRRPLEVKGPVELPPPGPARRVFFEKLLREHAGQVSDLARGIGYSRGAVHRWIRECELEPGQFRGPRLSGRNDELIAQLRLHHADVSRVAEAMGYTRGAVYRWIKRAGLSAERFRG